jgi:hypothetical protein
VKKLLAIACALAAVSAAAHSVSRDEVVAYLNAVGEREAIRLASSPEKLPELLVIEVSDDWSRISVDERRAIASNWLALWRHAEARGRVSVINKAGEAVVHYRPTGETVVK